MILLLFEDTRRLGNLDVDLPRLGRLRFWEGDDEQTVAVLCLDFVCIYFNRQLHRPDKLSSRTLAAVELFMLHLTRKPSFLS